MVRGTLPLKETVMVMGLLAMTLTTGCRSTPRRMAPDIQEYHEALERVEASES